MGWSLWVVVAVVIVCVSWFSDEVVRLLGVIADENYGRSGDTGKA
jgi:hypothetical protein